MNSRHTRFALLLSLAVAALAIAPRPSLAQSQQDAASAKLIQDVMQNQRALEARVRNYICLVHESVVSLDGDGREKKTETREYESFFVDRRMITRTLSKNGKPLDEGEKKKEEAKVEKQIREAHEAAAKREAGKPEKNEISVLTFLKTSLFDAPRQESVQGRAMLALDFRPNPAYSPKGLAETLAHKLSGTMWVDPVDMQVTRVTAKFDSKLNLGGGILGAVKPDSRFELTQQKLPEGLWMPSSSDINLDARLFIFGKRERVQMVFSNYRKFGASSRLGEAHALETPGEAAREATEEQTHPSEAPGASR